MDLIVAAIIFVAVIVQTTFGFGLGLLAIPVLIFILDLKTAVTLVLVFQVFQGILLVKEYKHIAWSRIGWMTLFLPVGVLFGFGVLTYLPPRWIEAGLGLYLLIYVVQPYLKINFALATQVRPKLLQCAMGAIGGFVQGVIGTGAPFLVTYLKSCHLPKEVFRSSVIFLLFTMNIFRIAYSARADFINAKILHLLPYSLLAFVLALIIGYRLPKFLSDRHFSLIIHFLLTLSGLSLLIKSSGMVWN